VFLSEFVDSSLVTLPVYLHEGSIGDAMSLLDVLQNVFVSSTNSKFLSMVTWDEFLVEGKVTSGPWNDRA
jgi:hypothetical protein